MTLSSICRYCARVQFWQKRRHCVIFQDQSKNKLLLFAIIARKTTSINNKNTLPGH